MLRNGSTVEFLQSVTVRDDNLSRTTPYWVIQILTESSWQHFADRRTWMEFSYTDFDDFVRAKPPGGLGRSGGSDWVRRICQAYEKDEEAKDEAARALQLLNDALPKAQSVDHAADGAKGGRGKKAVRNTNGLSGGTETQTYLLARLKRDHEALAAQVVAGEKSAHAAAVEAGIRQRMIQLSPTVDGFERAARKHLSAADVAQLKEKL